MLSSSADVDRLLELGFWGLVAVAAITVMVIAIWYTRKRLASDQDSQPGSWSIDHLESLRDRGELSEAEFRSIRARTLGITPEKPSEDD